MPPAQPHADGSRSAAICTAAVQGAQGTRVAGQSGRAGDRHAGQHPALVQLGISHVPHVAEDTEVAGLRWHLGCVFL